MPSRLIIEYMSEIEPRWETEYQYDYENFCAGQELLNSMRHMAQELKAGKQVSLLFTLWKRQAEVFVVNTDYEATLLGLEDTETPHLIVGDVYNFLIVNPEESKETAEDIPLGHHDIMRILLSDFTSMHYIVHKPKDKDQKYYW